VRRTLTLGALGACTLLASGLARATAAEVFEIGPRGRAFAGAGQSLDAGYESAFTNPAALAFAARPELTLGSSATHFALSVSRQGQGVPVSAPGSGGVLFGFVLPLHVLKEPWVLGFASQSPSNYIARATLPFSESPQFPLLVPQSQALDFDLGLGVTVWPWLKLGAGLRALAALHGTVQVSPSSAGTATAASDTLDPRFAPNLGALWSPSELDTLALSFHGALRADFDMELSATNLGATTLPPLHIAGVAAYDPAQLALEYRHRFGKLTLLGGLAFQRWSSFPSLLAATTSCPPSRPNCAALPAEPSHFHDTWQPHVAAEYRVRLRRSAIARLRAGYAYHRSPIPEQTAASNELDADRHVFGLGYGIELSAPLVPVRVDLGCELHELVARSEHKPPSVAPDNPGFPALDVAGHAESCALSVGVRLQ
jgi:long-chain fatty acid transport protein